MFSLVPYAFSWTGVFNQDYIQEAARACFSVPKAVRDVRWRRGSRCRPGVCDEKRAVTSEESLQTAFNNRKYITRRIRLYASPNSASTRLVDGYSLRLSRGRSLALVVLSPLSLGYAYLHCYSYRDDAISICLLTHLYPRARID